MHNLETLIDRRILVAGDDIDPAVMLGELVKAYSYLAKVAASGAEALEIASEWRPQGACSTWPCPPWMVSTSRRR